MVLSFARERALVQLEDRHCEPTGRANARPMTGSAKQSIEQQKRMDCFVASAFARRRASADRSAPRNDGEAWLRDLAASFARGILLFSRPLQTKGAGNAGRPMRPIAACAMGSKKIHTR
jgi:hypothetical protein